MVFTKAEEPTWDLVTGIKATVLRIDFLAQDYVRSIAFTIDGIDQDRRGYYFRSRDWYSKQQIELASQILHRTVFETEEGCISPRDFVPSDFMIEFCNVQPMLWLKLVTKTEECWVSRS